MQNLLGQRQLRDNGGAVVSKSISGELRHFQDWLEQERAIN
jgi:hypothetical protein